MPQPYDYWNAMGGQANIGGIPEAVNTAILGQQQVQNNQSVLDAQARADAARKAQAAILLGQSGGGQPASGMPGVVTGYGGGSWNADGSVATTPDSEAAASAAIGNVNGGQGGGQPMSDAEYKRNIAIIAAADPAMAQSMLRQRQMQSDLKTLVANPNPKSIFTFLSLYPEAKDGVEKAYKFMSDQEQQSALKTTSDAFGYLQAGDGEGAAQILEARMAADKAAGVDVSAYPHLIDLARTNPKAASVVAGSALATMMGPEKFADSYKEIGNSRRADELQPALVNKGVAEASKAGTEAQYAPQKAESDLATEQANRTKIAADITNMQEQVAVARERLALDKDTLETNTSLKLEELDQTVGMLDPATAKTVTESISSSITAQALADREFDIAAELRQSGARGGIGSSWAEWLKQSTGNQDIVSLIRAEFTGIRNNAAINLLPPGSASDKDIAFVQRGMPKDTDPPSYVADWLEAMGRTQDRLAKVNDRQGNWIAANKSLGPATRDINVGGTMVPRGTTFTEFNKRSAGSPGNPAPGAKAPLPPSISTMLDKYGKK